MEVWLPPGYTNIFPPKGIAGKKNDSKVPKGLRDMWSFLPEGAHWSVLKSLHPMNMNGWTFKSPLFWDPEKSSKEPIHLLPRLGVPWKTCQFSGGCIGFNPLGASWRVTIWPPTPGEKASCSKGVWGMLLVTNYTENCSTWRCRCFFFWGIHKGGGAFLVKHRHGGEFLGVPRGEDELMKESRTEGWKKKKCLWGEVNLHPRSLTARPSKSVAGRRRLSYWEGNFSGAKVKLREGTFLFFPWYFERHDDFSMAFVMYFCILGSVDHRFGKYFLGGTEGNSGVALKKINTHLLIFQLVQQEKDESELLREREPPVPRKSSRPLNPRFVPWNRWLYTLR